MIDADIIIFVSSYIAYNDKDFCCIYHNTIEIIPYRDYRNDTNQYPVDAHNQKFKKRLLHLIATLIWYKGVEQKLILQKRNIQGWFFEMFLISQRVKTVFT